MTICNSCDCDGKYYVGDIGTVLLVDTCEDISSATLTRLYVQKPDGETYEWDGTVSDTTKIMYTTVDGDLDQAGTYLLQAYVVTPSWSGRGNKAEFKVSELFS